MSSAEQLLILGYSYQTKGKNQEAIKSYEQAAEIANERDNHEIKAKAYQHLGNVFTISTEYKKAIECYQKAREAFPGLKAGEMEITAFQWLGYNCLQANQYQESTKYYYEATKIASQLGISRKRSMLALDWEMHSSIWVILIRQKSIS